ncbi:LPXTG-motif cell wall anchor domain protein [Gleimia coleocanis DSM 15436]|uniref:LPXTG-motif cell wall anchor domain protein n=1 Tax=Gleimia coleocanis DSM 15436 TaxID=525245 RepID=C0W0Z0_9ACTO|nr:Cna B-type domain-containing protein [Gleimia coleocanis]EEH63714.1 LPXTG-motif cell wall anchor domain protein [Gleimia coleocanis DSM 15436]
MKKFFKILVALAFVVALLPLNLSSVKANAAEGQFNLDFVVKRPEFSALENLQATYFNYWATQTDGGGIVDIPNWKLKDFQITYELVNTLNNTTTTGVLQYVADEFSWSNGGKVSFSGIPVNHSNVVVEYYSPEGEQFFAPYLLKYSLRLENAGDQLVLKVPKLKPDAVAAPTGNEKVLQIRDIKVTEKALFIDGVNGSDANDGTTPSTAVKTLEKAKSLAVADPQIGSIRVIGAVTLSNDIDFNGVTAKLVRGENYSGYLLAVPSGAVASLANITVDGNGDSLVGKKSLVRVAGTLTLKEGAVLENNRIQNPRNTRTFGGALYVSNSAQQRAVLKMEGGVIRNNQASDGGGIFLEHADFDFSAGVVENNRAIRLFDTDVQQFYAAGGGIQAEGGAHLRLSGEATVRNNQADEVGGGISLGSNTWSDRSATLDMVGGVIEGNSAGAAGGGLFIQSAAYGAQHVGNVSAGKIINNRMDGSGRTNQVFGGGGIYVNGTPNGFAGLTWKHGLLNLTNAIITDNNAEFEGGGFAACPISVSEINIAEGSAIYGNHAKASSRLSNSSKTLINEVFLYSNPFFGIHSGEAVYKVTDTMLGGVPYNWVDTSTGQPLAADKAAGTLLVPAGQAQAHLGLNTSAVPSERTKALAKVFITGNYSATRGGGIGSNGAQTFGVDKPVIDIPVQKYWNDADNQDGKRPDKVIVKLFADNEDINYSLELSDANKWSGVFKYLPKFKTITLADGTTSDKEISYSLKEVTVDGYEVAITGDVEKGFTVTNSYSPEVTSLTVMKKWVDHTGKTLDKKLPKEIQLQLWAEDGTEKSKVGDLVVIRPDENGKWEHTFTDLPRYREGKEVKYVVTETEVPGFKTKVEVVNKQLVVITNQQEIPPIPPVPPTVDIPKKELPKTGVELSGLLFLAVVTGGLGTAVLRIRSRANRR